VAAGAVARLAWTACPGQIVLAAAQAAAAGLAPAVAAWQMRAILDLAAGSGTGARIPAAAIGLLCVSSVVMTVVPYWNVYVQSQIRRATTSALLDRLFAAASRLPGLRYFEDPGFQDRLQLAQQAGAGAPAQLISSVTAVGQRTVTVAGFALALGAFYPPLLAASVIAALPVMAAQIQAGRQRFHGNVRMNPVSRRRLAAVQLLSDPGTVKEIRLFGLGTFLRRRIADDQAELNRIDRAADVRVAASQGGLGAAGALLGAAVMAWTVVLTVRGTLTVGDLTATIAALGGIQAGLGGAFFGGYGVIQAARLHDYYRQIATMPLDLPIAAAAADPGPLREGIRFEDVWFRYTESGPWILRGLTLSIPAGQTVALAGENGAGKTTIVKLLGSLYDPVRGRITWDGTDLRELDPERLRDRIGAVLQDFTRYQYDAHENIAVGDVAALGRPDTPRRVSEAAGQAGVHDFLAGLEPDGYHTMLTRIYLGRPGAARPPTGVVPSGGQWQRIAIARALMRGDRDLLILDEPSAGLDPDAEYRIHRALRTARRQKTSLLITHRLGAVRDADEILVLAAGAVTERGTHAQLMDVGGTYARLFSRQAEGYQDRPAAPPAPDGPARKLARDGAR
jgi:ATP-binding cassette subfamily B protein